MHAYAFCMGVMTLDVLTAEELADRLAISPRTVERLARDGIIPQVRVSERIRRYILSDVVLALKKREVTHARTADRT